MMNSRTIESKNLNFSITRDIWSVALAPRRIALRMIGERVVEAVGAVGRWWRGDAQTSVGPYAPPAETANPSRRPVRDQRRTGEACWEVPGAAPESGRDRRTSTWDDGWCSGSERRSGWTWRGGDFGREELRLRRESPGLEKSPASREFLAKKPNPMIRRMAESSYAERARCWPRCVSDQVCRIPATNSPEFSLFIVRANLVRWDNDEEIF